VSTAGEAAVLELAATVDTLIGELDAAPDSQLRSTALSAVSALTTLYGEALRRIVSQWSASSTIHQLAADPLLEHLLIAHDLHPDSLERRVEAALDEVRPYLRSHGGDVELLAIEADRVRVRLNGHCRGCAASADTLRQRVEVAVQMAAPELRGITTDEPAPPAGLVQLQSRKSAQRHHGAEAVVRCELCSREIMPVHRHLLDLHERRLLCACPACATLFAHGEAGGHHYRLIADRHQKLPADLFDDAAWANLRVPVDVAFFFHDSRQGRPVALYHGPAGATESLLQLEAWDDLRGRTPLLDTVVPDVEAVLVSRGRVRQSWIVPVDRCYELTGLMRAHWRGLGGGSELWERIEKFFEEMEREHG